MAIIKDRMIYVVVSAHKDGALLSERNVCDLDRATTIKDIATGQFGEVDQVLECNPVEGTCRDVTDDILTAVEAFDSEDGLLHPHPQFAAWDHARDLRKHEVA
jgi:hypothetical protein